MLISIDSTNDDAQAGIALDRCGMPAFLADWVDRFYEPVDLAMLALSGGGGRSESGLGAALVAAGHAADLDAARAIIRRAVIRGVLSDTSGSGIQPADFHVRFDYWALFEGWLDISTEVRWLLNEWELGTYIDTHRQTAVGLKAGKPRDPYQVVPEYVLLHEAQAEEHCQGVGAAVVRVEQVDGVEREGQGRDARHLADGAPPPARLPSRGCGCGHRVPRGGRPAPGGL